MSGFTYGPLPSTISIKDLDCCLIVTEQTGARPHGTLTHDPIVSVEENRFLLTGFQPRGYWERFCSEPSSPVRTSTSLAPEKATSQSYAQKFPVSLSVLTTAVQTDPHPLQNVHSWVSESPSSHSSSLHQDLECAVLSLHLMAQGNMGHVTPGHGGVQGGTRPKRMTPLYILQRSRSLKLNIPGHSSAPSISHKYVLG